MSIGKRIREKRKELNMSADELGEILGKNRATIYRYESDEIENLPLSILEPLSEALKVSPAYLMGWDESKEEVQPNTLAAHLPDGVKLTEEEEKDIRNFVSFVLSQREDDNKDE